MKESPEEAESPRDESGEAALVQNRLHNLEQIDALTETYPFRFDPTAPISRIVEENEPKSGEELEGEALRVRAAGRILARRVQGKAGFLDLSDGRSRLQVYVRQDAVGEPGWTLYKSLDLGDWIGVAGPLFRTRTGQLSVKAERLAFLAKCLRPLPEKWHGLRDVELRHRRRYLDLAV
ncbi:MAG TPA: OB-fold nucleic acid binding domain-containing protein, partial [Thermoanaerobaculia bacterium]